MASVPSALATIGRSGRTCRAAVTMLRTSGYAGTVTSSARATTHACGFEHDGLAGVTVNDWNPGRPRLPHAPIVELDQDVRQIQMRERVSDASPDAAPARDEHMVRQPRTRKVDGFECLSRATRPETFIDHGREAGHRRREHHRHDRGVERECVHVVANGAARQADTRQNERKLSHLKQRQADGKRDDVPVAKGADDARQNRGFARRRSR